jgi:hypothetical protein
MSGEHVVYLKNTVGEGWTEASRHADREAAYDAIKPSGAKAAGATIPKLDLSFGRGSGRRKGAGKTKEALPTRRPGATAKIDPGAELFLRGVDGKIVEVMSD